MPTRLLLALLALSSAAALPGCDLPLVGCSEHADCASCAGDHACAWSGGACEPIFDRNDGAVAGAIIDPAFCPGTEALACSFDGDGSFCATGRCLGGVCVRAVTGTVGWRYWKPDGTTQLVSPGPDGYTVTAHTFAPGGRPWETLTIPDAATGAYSIFVPPGEVTLTLWDPVGHPHSTVTTAPVVDFVRDVAGRLDETFPAGPATFRFNLANLVAWNTGFSSGIGDEVQLTTSGGHAGWLTATNNGATVLPFDFALEGWPLHTPAAGDWALVYQRANLAWTATNGSGTWNYIAAQRGAAVATPFSGGAYQEVSLGLSALTTASVSFDWRFADLSQYASSLGPTVNTWSYAASVSAHPYTLASEVMPPSELLYLPVWTPRPNTIAGPLTYGRPGVPGGYEVSLAELSAQVPVTAPGASQPAYIQALLRREAALTATVATTPALGPVRFVQHGDLTSAFTPRAGVGPMPELRWTAPAVGVPSAYVVRVHRLDNDAGTTLDTVVGQVVTTATSVRIPPGVLESGNTYVATVSARTGTGNLTTEPLRQLGWPRAISRVVTAEFSP